MLNQDANSKALFMRLEKATAATPKKDMEEGRPQNPLGALHWSMEHLGPVDHKGRPGTYKITMMKGSLIVAQKTASRAELESADAVEHLVLSMFEGIPAQAA